MELSLDMFLEFPGILIVVGVLLLIVSLIISLISKKRIKKEDKKPVMEEVKEIVNLQEEKPILKEEKKEEVIEIKEATVVDNNSIEDDNFLDENSNSNDYVTMDDSKTKIETL